MKPMSNATKPPPLLQNADMDENSCKNVDSTLRQTSEEVTHEDNHDVRPRTPIHKARIYKDGNPSSLQPQKNPDPQFLETKMPVDENSSKHVEYTLRQTSGGLTHDDNHVVTPRTPVRNKAKTYEDGMQTHDHQSENQLDTMKTMKIDVERTVSAQSPSANGPIRLKECKDKDEEPPLGDMLVEDLRFEERSKISKSRKQKLIRLKDEELKQKEETYSATIKRFEKQIQNFHAKHDEGKGREKKLENDNKELKDENKKNNNELKELEKENNMVKYEKTILEEGVKKIKELEDEKAILKEDVKKIKELEDEIARLKERDVKGVKKIKELEDEKAILKEDVKKIKELEDENARLKERDVKGVKKIKELEDEKAILKEGVKKIKELEDEIARLKEGVKKTKELEAEIARLKEEIENLKMCNICYAEEKQYVAIPCGHYGFCQNCFDEEDHYFHRKCPFCRDEITDYVKVYNM